MSADNSTSHILTSLAVNLVIAVLKFTAAFFTGSGAMLAEAIHSFADCGNQLLLLVGVRAAKRPPDAKHPLGHGRSMYFWSFMVALLLFSGGGVFSIYEGFHKISHPEPLAHVGWALAVLVTSLVLEGWATWGNIRALNARRGTTPFVRYLRDTKDSDLVVVFGENSAAVLGLFIATMALVVAYVTGNALFDSIGSLLVGVVLVFVAVFLAVEVKSLLVGESADPVVEQIAREIIEADPRIEQLIHMLTVQQGPGEVLVCAKIRCQSTLTFRELSVVINAFEAGLRGKMPACRWIYVEPDAQEWKTDVAATDARAPSVAPHG